MSFHFAARHLFPSSVGSAVSAQRRRRPRTCSRTNGGAAKCMVKVHSRCSELQRRARSFRAKRIQLRICSEAVSISAWSALVGLVESRAFCGSQALASCVINACCERYLCSCTGVGYGTPAQERHALSCPFHKFEVHCFIK